MAFPSGSALPRYDADGIPPETRVALARGRRKTRYCVHTRTGVSPAVKTAGVGAGNSSGERMRAPIQPASRNRSGAGVKTNW